MSTTDTGRYAEAAAATYLMRRGYRIVAQNWRTRWCEIDIVAQKGDAIHFVEVKYRRSADWGRGLEYITKAKQKQMYFAAAFWIARHKWTGNATLAAVEVSGPDFVITQFILIE